MRPSNINDGGDVLVRGGVLVLRDGGAQVQHGGGVQVLHGGDVRSVRGSGELALCKQLHEPLGLELCKLQGQELQQ